MTEQQLGFDKAPDRYSKTGRETIDKIRDSMTDDEFIAYCRGQVIRYRDRAGLKGPEEEDLKKAKFYEEMALSIITNGNVKDPRSYRENFAEYRRQAYVWSDHELPLTTFLTDTGSFIALQGIRKK